MTSKMKIWTNPLILGSLAIAVSSLAGAAESKAVPQQQKTVEVPNTIPYNLHDEYDKTDILMVPLDSTEDYQNEEIETIDNDQRLPSAKAKTQAKPVAAPATPAK